MARTRTLAQLRADVRYLADVADQTARHTDADLARVLNQAISEYRRTFLDYFLTTSTSTTTADVATLALPADLDYLERLEIDSGNGVVYVLFPHEGAEARDYDASSFEQRSLPSSYRIEGSTLTLTPTPDSGYTVTFTYLPQQTDFTSDDDAFDPVLSGGEQWVTYWAARYVAMRDLSPAVQGRYQTLAAELQRCEASLRRLARTPGPGRRVDTRGRRRDVEIESRYRYWRRT